MIGAAYHRRAWFAIAMIAIGWPRAARGELARHLRFLGDDSLLGVADLLPRGLTVRFPDKGFVN